MDRKKFLLLAMVIFLSSFNLELEVWAEGNEGEHHSYVGGYSDGTIKPNNNITREEASVVLQKALELEENKTGAKMDFKDLKEDKWSFEYIKAVFDNELIKGYKDGNFKPNDNISRAETVAIIARYKEANLDNIVVSNSEYKNHWGSKEIQYAVDSGIIKGYKDGTVKPNANITRAEFIVIINNLLGRKCDIENIKTTNKFIDVKSNNWFYKDIMEATNTHKISEQNKKPGEKTDDSKNIPSAFTGESLIEEHIKEFEYYLTGKKVPLHIKKDFESYFREQIKVTVTDANIIAINSSKSDELSPISFYFRSDKKIGGKLSLNLASNLGDINKGITITTYINNGTEWNKNGESEVKNIPYSKSGMRGVYIYNLYYDSIKNNDLTYHMVPEDTIDADVLIDFNNGQYIKYNIKQDVTNKYFNKEYYGIDKQWNHETKPIRKR